MSWLSLLHPAIPRAGYVKGNDDLLAEQPVAVDNALALVVFRSIYASELEPPIGIEPMTTHYEEDYSRPAWSTD